MRTPDPTPVEPTPVEVAPVVEEVPEPVVVGAESTDFAE
jgi:hypothetical protein